jgi:hypothetical protein
MNTRIFTRVCFICTRLWSGEATSTPPERALAAASSRSHTLSQIPHLTPRSPSSLTASKNSCRACVQAASAPQRKQDLQSDLGSPTSLSFCSDQGKSLLHLASPCSAHRCVSVKCYIYICPCASSFVSKRQSPALCYVRSKKQ